MTDPLTHTRNRRGPTRLLDIIVCAHGSLRGHRVFVRGKPRVWRCARHDCDWTYTEAAS